MSEIPPPERKPEPLGFTPGRPHAPGKPQTSSSSSMSRNLMGKTIGDRYRIRGVLGEGGMGMVYDAEHLGLSRSVAIKVLAPSQAKKKVAVKRFQQEARAAGAIGHPNICEVYDMGLLDDGSPYLVMEKLVGNTLADRIVREGGLPFDEISDIIVQVLSGLIAAHEKGIIHRDIKPENIFLAQRTGCPPVAKILDFGVSKMLPQFAGDGEPLDLTRTGMVMGTPYYMSPEQARGDRNLDGRVDVYACGVMLYEMIVGKRPFLAPNYNALLLAIINTSPRRISEARPATPPALETIVANAMAKVRDQRYPTAHHMLRDVQALRLSKQRVPAATRSPRSRRATEPPIREDGPGATLRSRMAEARPPADPRGEATRLDVPRTKTPWSSPQGVRLVPPPTPESDSVDIPIHVTGEAPALPDADDDEIPTEILRPGQPLRQPVQPRPRSDWDQATVVKRPAKPFNPDETVKMESVEVDFGDETRVAPPRRKR